MLKYKHICDKCKKEVEQDSAKIPNDWVKLWFKVKSYSYPDEYVEKSLCEDCSKELGIVRDKRQSEDTHLSSIGDRLVEILTEIMQGETHV